MASGGPVIIIDPLRGVRSMFSTEDTIASLRAYADGLESGEADVEEITDQSDGEE